MTVDLLCHLHSKSFAFENIKFLRVEDGTKETYGKYQEETQEEWKSLEILNVTSPGLGEMRYMRDIST